MTVDARTYSLLLAPVADAASLPDVATVPAGALCPVESEGLIYRLDDTGTTWEEWATLGTANAVTSVGTITKIDGPITQAEYDALTAPADDTLYAIVG